jgi:hypothetical protein
MTTCGGWVSWPGVGTPESGPVGFGPPLSGWVGLGPSFLRQMVPTLLDEQTSVPGQSVPPCVQFIEQ